MGVCENIFFLNFFVTCLFSKAGQIWLIDDQRTISYLDTYNYSAMLGHAGHPEHPEHSARYLQSTLRAETQRPASWGPKAGLKQA